jgi:hypothetical protein
MKIIDKINNYLIQKLFLKKGEVMFTQEEKEVIEKFMKLASDYNPKKFTKEPGKRLAYLIRWSPYQEKLTSPEQKILMTILKKLKETIEDIKDTELQ